MAARLIKLPVVLRGNLEQASVSMKVYMRHIEPAERAAIFGALEEEWCRLCGSTIDRCKCKALKPDGSRSTGH